MNRSHRTELRRSILKNEKFTLRVNHEFGEIKILLLFPNQYQIAISSLAWQSVYYIFNLSENIQCHRTTIEFSNPLSSIETNQNFYEYDLVAVHFSTELDYLNFIQILQTNKIPLGRNQRSKNYPIFIAGGFAISLFPEILESVFDFIILGEVEIFYEQLQNLFNNYEQEKVIWESIMKFDNIYYPSKNTIHAHHLKTGKNIEKYPVISPIITKQSHFKNILLIETAKGCPSLCYFCAASYLNNPVRYKSFNHIRDLIHETDLSLYNKIGYIAPALSFHPELKQILEFSLEINKPAALSSLRADKLDSELAGLICRNQIQSITLAPETGSEEDRYKINKPITDQQIFKCIDLLETTAKISELRLYFMIGFGFSNEEQKITQLIKKIDDLFSRKITVSITPFIPKKRTPFSQKKMSDIKYLKKCYKHFRFFSKQHRKIQLNLASIKESVLQYQLSNEKDYFLSYQ